MEIQLKIRIYDKYWKLIFVRDNKKSLTLQSLKVVKD